MYGWLLCRQEIVGIESSAQVGVGNAGLCRVRRMLIRLELLILRILSVTPVRSF
jgi:hypothetical protein